MDEEVVLLMTDEQLQKYIPKLGDRIALKNFTCKNSSTLGPPQSDNKKRGLMERLRQRLMARSHNKENETDNQRC